MSEKRSDPLAIWQNMIGEMEKGFNAFTNRGTTSAESGNPGGGTGAQQRLGDLMEKYLGNMNMPSRSQMVSIADRLDSIEGQLSEIKALLQRTQMPVTSTEASAKAAPKPPRNKRLPHASEEQK